MDAPALNPPLRISDVNLPPALRLQSRSGWRWDSPRELWRYRDLFWRLALRDVQVRYKQAILGVAWAVLQPVAVMIVLSVVLGQLLDRPDAADPVFLFAALLPWTFFASSVVASSQSLIANANLLGKVYFPRLLMPLASVGAPLVDLAISLLVLAGLMLWQGRAFTPGLLWLPMLVISALLAALSVGVPLAALTVAYRDFKYVTPFLVQIGFFLSPVMYGAQSLPAVAWLNPMTGVIAGFRAAVLAQPLNLHAWLLSTLAAALLLIVGLAYFNHVERRFADIV